MERMKIEKDSVASTRKAASLFPSRKMTQSRIHRTHRSSNQREEREDASCAVHLSRRPQMGWLLAHLHKRDAKQASDRSKPPAKEQRRPRSISFVYFLKTEFFKSFQTHFKIWF
jgi:hypothetical protein